jgi:hypothetical protein
MLTSLTKVGPNLSFLLPFDSSNLNQLKYFQKPDFALNGGIEGRGSFSPWVFPPRLSSRPKIKSVIRESLLAFYVHILTTTSVAERVAFTITSTGL